MRERDEVRASVRYYKYVVLRIRFPENIILQGVFRPQHKLSDVRQFICNELIDPTLIFNLHHLHQCLNDDKASLAQLGLAPAAVLCLSWKSPVDGDIDCYMNPQLIQNMQQF
jgi:UBX domain-containing protein 6